MKTWSVFRHLTWSQRGTLVLAVFLLPSCAVLLRLAPLNRLLPRKDAPEASSPAALASARAAARAVNLVAVRFGATCLSRSLALQWILAARGIPTDLRVGVRSDGEGLDAHAWLECDGVPVNDDAHAVRPFTALEWP